MRGAYYLLTAMLLLALAAAGASADPVLAREVAMGFTQVGLGDAANAFVANPAGLSSLPESNGGMKSLAAFSVRVDDEDGDAWSALYSASSGSKPIGWGAGFWQTDMGSVESDFFGVGFGGRLVRNGELTGGLSLINASRSGQVSAAQDGLDDDTTSLNVGLMYHLMPATGRVRVGAVVNDVTDELPGDVTVDLGASVLLPQGLLVALDVNDVADEIETTVNVGAEYALQGSGVLLRAGAVDGDLTAGGGYRWREWEAGLGWADLDGGDMVVLSVGGWW